MVLLVKYEGVKLPAQGQFCSQHEFEMDSDPLSVVLRFPFPLIAEGLILKGSIGWNPDSTAVKVKKKNQPWTVEVNENRVPWSPVPSSPAGFLIEDGRMAAA